MPATVTSPLPGLRRTLRTYGRLLLAGIRRQSTYRLAAFGGLVANTTFGLLKVAILFSTVRAAGGELNGYDIGSISAYIWISQGMLGSVNLTRFVRRPFTEEASFDWDEYRDVVRTFTRMLDNVVEINGLPLGRQRDEITRKRRHGMGFLGLGSTITMLGMKYGSPESVAFTDNVSREMAIAGWEAGVELAREKGPAPIMNEEFTVTRAMLRKRPEMARDGWKL